MCTWDLVDGQCIESVKLYQVHSQIQVLYYLLNYYYIFRTSGLIHLYYYELQCMC